MLFLPFKKKADATRALSVWPFLMLFLPFKKKADATLNYKCLYTPCCFYLSKRRQMQHGHELEWTMSSCFYLSKRRQMQPSYSYLLALYSCFYLSKRRQMQLIFSKRLISNLFSLFFRLYFLTSYLLES